MDDNAALSYSSSFGKVCCFLSLERNMEYLLDSEVISSKLGIVNAQVDTSVDTGGILDLDRQCLNIRLK